MDSTCNQCRESMGLAKLKREPRVQTKRTGSQIEPAVDQVWEDMQARSEGRKRRLRIVRVECDDVYFVVLGEILRSGPRRAARQRFTGVLKGYRYIGEQEV